MIVVRFKVRCQPGKAGPLIAKFNSIIIASRPLEGTVSFDIGRDLADPDSFVAVEVFEDRAALERQESLAEVRDTMGMFDEVLAEPPEMAIFHVSSSEP